MAAFERINFDELYQLDNPPHMHYNIYTKQGGKKWKAEKQEGN
jgi:hypothetical protein